MTPVDDEAPPGSAADSLALIRKEQAVVGKAISLNPMLYYVPWGLAWFIGFGLLFLRYGPDSRVYVAMPDWLPLVTLFVLMALAMVSTTLVSIVRQRGVEGQSAWKGTAYGFAWFLSFAGMGTTLGRIADLLPEPERGLLWACSSVGLVSAMYMCGAAIWLSRDMFIFGAWLTVINIVGVLAGPGWHSLIISLGGGGGLIVLGLLLLFRESKGR
ncbi:transporter [Dactylosporangium sp. NPDC051541]|uniref:transporter n=1 Tax=Dactylosporangium sp. NPDC051541 TaxID=3363977 RepID=UPI0037ADE94B